MALVLILKDIYMSVLSVYYRGKGVVFIFNGVEGQIKRIK